MNDFETVKSLLKEKMAPAIKKMKDKKSDEDVRHPSDEELPKTGEHFLKLKAKLKK